MKKKHEGKKKTSSLSLSFPDHFKQLFDRSEASRQGHERVRLVEHHPLCVSMSMFVFQVLV